MARATNRQRETVRARVATAVSSARFQLKGHTVAEGIKKALLLPLPQPATSQRTLRAAPDNDP